MLSVSLLCIIFENHLTKITTTSPRGHWVNSWRTYGSHYSLSNEYIFGSGCISTKDPQLRCWRTGATGLPVQKHPETYGPDITTYTVRRRYWAVRYNINLRMHRYSDWCNIEITVWATKGIQCHALFVCHRGVPCVEFGDKLTAVQLQRTDYHAQKSVVCVWSEYRVIWISLVP